MASLLSNLKKHIRHKRYSLRQYGVGIIFFSALSIYTQVWGKPLCLLQNLFGVACFGCGMTRGFISILHLRFAQAWNHNILSIPLFFGILLHAGLLLVDICLGTQLVEKLEHCLSRWWMYPIYGSMLLLATLANNSLLFS